MAQSKYKLELEVLKEKFRSKGNSITEAFENLGLSWEQVKGKGIVRISKGTLNYEHIFNMAVLRRIIHNKITRGFWDKNLEFMINSTKKTNIPEVNEIKDTNIQKKRKL